MKSLLIGAMVLCVTITTAIADPGIRDSIRISADTLQLNQSMPITVTFYNDELLDWYDICYAIDPITGGFAVFDSLVYVGRLADPQVIDVRGNPMHNVDSVAADTFALFGYQVLGQYLPPGGGAVAKMYFTGVSSGSMEIRASSYPPLVERNKFGLADPDNVSFAAHFVGDTVEIIEGLALPTISSSAEVSRDVAGSTIEFAVTGASPAGLPVEVEFLSLAGYDDSTRAPTNPPSVVGTNPIDFSWLATANDIGIWRATFRCCDSAGGCVTTESEIQIVASADFLVDLDVAVTDEGLNGNSICRGNLDADPNPEILVTGEGFGDGRTLATYDFDFVGSLELASLVDDGKSKFGARLGFFDADDHLDAVLMELIGPTTLQVWLGNGDNSLSLDQESPYSRPTRGSVLAEFTGDKYLDYASVYLNGVGILAGDSGLVFNEISFVPTGDSALSLIAADFDGDGYDDLAIGTSEGLEIYLNDGAGGFALAHSYSQQYGALDIQVTNEGSDFNGDNLFDLCLATPSIAGEYSQLVIYLGQGDGSFEQRLTRIVKGYVYANTTGDLNNDGYLDVAYVNAGQRYLALMFGDGDGNFTNEIRFDVPGYSPQRLISLDADLDGDLDIAVCAFDRNVGSLVAYYENPLDPPGVSSVTFELTAHNNAAVQLTSATGKVLNEIKSSISAADYFQRDVDRDAMLDDYIAVNVAEYGAYTLSVSPKPNIPVGAHFSIEFDLNGQPYRLVDDQPMPPGGYNFGVYPSGSSEVTPPPGSFLQHAYPTFMWPGDGSFDFELAADPQFLDIVFATTVTGNSVTPPAPLEVTDTALFYWHVKPTGAPEFDVIYAMNLVAGEAACGDIDGSTGPPNVADLSFLVAYFFLDGPPPPDPSQADIDGSPGVNVGDLSYLVSYLFLGGPPPICE